MNILLVDDDAIDREIVKKALKNNNEFSLVYEVSSAEEGLKVAEECHFDVLLLDYKMQKNAIEMIMELQSNPNLEKTAIIMVSASDDEALALSCLEAGAQDFITKNEINASKLKRAIVQAKKRFELEKELYDSFNQVRELAEKDSLTGLANRYHFEKSLQTSVENNKRKQNNMALFMLDLDHFKNVNDTYGHDIGDQLLKQVTLRIKKCLRGNELFGRLGGDEFAILITDLKFIEDATIVAQRIIQSLNMPFHIDSHQIQCGISLGIAIHPNNTDSAKTLTKYADIATYRAKKQGRNQLCYFEKAMQEQFSRKYKVEIELKNTIKNGGFELHFQPVINSNNHQLIGLEALLRWPNGPLKTTPDEFIPIAEKSRLIIQIGEWVVEQAIQQLSIWKNRFSYPITMAINISTVQLGEESFILFLKSILKKYNITAQSVILEFTETALLERDEKNNQCINKLYDLGCTLALDDFGTGFSSLSHLLNYPIDIVKLDKSLLPNKSSDKRHLAIVKGLAAMVNTIGLRIIAEGVETKFQSDLCHKLSIDELQGFYFDKALPATDVEKKWLNSYII